jgi:hypothetical protein
MKQDFFLLGLGNEQQVVTVRSYIRKKKSGDFVANVVLRTMRMYS